MVKGREYRITTAFKQSTVSHQEFTDYRQLYDRVTRLTRIRISQLKHLNEDEFFHIRIVRQGWGCLGAPYNFATAFLTVGLSCLDSGETRPTGEEVPTPALLMAPYGIESEPGARADSGYRSDEIFNEFDFTDRFSATTDPVMLSYGERFQKSEAINFEPFINRAEQFAKVYYEFLQGEPRYRKEPFQILGREWYSVTNPNLAVVHVYFQA